MTTRNRELASIIDASGNITATGNLTVSGTTLTASSTVETHADPLIELNTGAGSNSNDLGFVFERGSTGDNACIIWDESSDGFAVGTTTATGTSTGNMTFTSGDFAAGKVTVDNVLINGTTIGHTSDTDLITLADGLVTVAGEISVTTLDIGGTNVSSTAAELNILDGVSSTAAELNILDGVTATAAEINFLDGDTSATGTTLASADRVIVNDAGTMKQVALSDFETFFESEIDTFSTIDINGGTIDGATVGANSASSGAFTTLSASGALTGTLGTAAQGNVTSLGTLTTLTVDNVIINGTTIGHTGDTDLLTVASGVLTVAGELDAASLDISGDADIDGTLEADAITIDGVTLSETIADTVGAMVGSNTESGITVAYQDGDNTLDFTVGTLNQDTTGTAATVTTAAQPAITSLGTLTTLTVDNVIVNGTTIGHTGDTDLLTLASGILTVAGEVQATTLDIGGTNITATAAELNIIDGDTSAVSTTLVDADRVIVNDNGTMKQVAMSDVKSYNPGKTTEEIQDTVGAMFTGNTETNVTVTYQDGDGTIDVVGLTQPNTILRVVARSGHIDCDVTDMTLPVTARSGTVTVRKVSLPVQVIPQVTYR
jgi:cytoskeletal protein CcmA (bactofilin family)